MKKRILFLSFILILTSLVSFSQQEEATKQDAKSYFMSGDYKGALLQYLDLLKKDSTNVDFNLKVGICYVETNIDKTNAIPYLDFVVSQKEFDAVAYLYLGRAYSFAYEFDKAIGNYNSYLAKGNLSEYDILLTKRDIEMCENAKELIKNPISIEFKNLGEKINSEYPDYLPWVPENEGVLVFTSKRKGNIGGAVLDIDGSILSDVYYCKVKYGKFSKAKNIGGRINSMNNDIATSVSANGKYIVMNVDNVMGLNDLYVSSKKGRSFNIPEMMHNSVNTAHFEEGACLSSDGNTLYVARENVKNENNTDIFMQKKLPNGEWSPGVSLGENVNTDFNEGYPMLSDDGMTLYFSSEGHTGMGGYDLFKSKYDEVEKKWGKAENLGYPLNTPCDEKNISFSETGIYAYVSALREDSYGDLDLYKVTFLDKESKFTVYRGVVCNSDTLNIFEDNEVLRSNKIYIEVKDFKTKEVYGKYRAHRKTGRYIMILPADREFSVTINVEEYDMFEKKYVVMGKSSYVEEINKDIILHLEGTTPKPQ